MLTVDSRLHGVAMPESRTDVELVDIELVNEVSP
jgi:hypothetical protein